MQMNANIIIDILILIFISIGIFTTLLMFFLICRYRRQSPFTSTTLLICNNYITVLICCVFTGDMYVCNLYGHIHVSVSFDNGWCYIRAYLTGVGLASIFYSYSVQACFRLFRIVFYKHKKLQTFPFISCLIFLQWLFCFLIFVPVLLLHYIEYIKLDYYYCQISYTNVPAIIYNGVFLYYLPMASTGFIYLYIVYYMKHRKNWAIQQQRQQANQRDLVVLRRILVLIGMLVLFMLPSVPLFLWYVITGYLHPMINQAQWVSFSVGLVMLPTMMAMITPQLRDLLNRQFRPNYRIHPGALTRQFELQQTHTVQPTMKF